MSRVLFLDFDGVLHAANEASFDADCRIDISNPRLFAWVPILDDLLAPHPDVRIVASTDWQFFFDDEALAGLLGPLGPRLLGATEIRCESRAGAIRQYALRHSIQEWRALDDNESVLEASLSDARYIYCPPDEGVTALSVQTSIKAWLWAR